MVISTLHRKICNIFTTSTLFTIKFCFFNMHCIFGYCSLYSSHSSVLKATYVSAVNTVFFLVFNLTIWLEHYGIAGVTGRIEASRWRLEVTLDNSCNGGSTGIYSSAPFIFNMCKLSARKMWISVSLLMMHFFLMLSLTWGVFRIWGPIPSYQQKICLKLTFNSKGEQNKAVNLSDDLYRKSGQVSGIWLD